MSEKRELRGRKGTGTRRAYEEIRRLILSLQLAPGADLDEQALIRLLRRSRTPIREALIQLAAEGLVEILPNRGARVAPLDLAGVREFFEALDAAQRMATRLAALRRSAQDLTRIDRHRVAFEKAAAAGDLDAMLDVNLAFHNAIGAACGNCFVAKHYAQILAFGLRLSRLALTYEGTRTLRQQHLETIVNEHRAMVRAIIAGDADAAEELARGHTDTFRSRVLEYMSSSLTSEMSF